MQVFVFILLMKRFRSFTWLNINIVFFRIKSLTVFVGFKYIFTVTISYFLGDRK